MFTVLHRHQKTPSLWGTLAAAAISKKQLDTAEVALCEVNEIAKVCAQTVPIWNQYGANMELI